MLTTREGHNLLLRLKSEDGKSKELDDSDVSVIIDTRRKIASLIKSSVINLDVYSLYLISALSIKHIIHSDYLSEKKALLNQKLGFIPKILEIEFNGRNIVFDLTNELSMQILYQVLSIFLKNSYMLKPEYSEGVVIDAGSNLGVFSLYAAASGAKNVHAFEPVSQTFNVLKQNVTKNSMDSIITLHNCALGSENTLSKIYFDSKGDQTASLSSSSKANFQDIKVEKLDDLFSNTPVSFIKIDTEGFEHEILSGAKSILSKYKPVLCLSAYHKPQDKSVLPSFIQSIRSDYDVKLVNHGEDNLFCS